jgi:hypothetical protein
VTDRGGYDPVRLAIRLLDAVRRLHADSLRIDTLGLDRRSGDRAVRRAIEQGDPPDSIAVRWVAGLDRFIERRRPHLLY